MSARASRAYILEPAQGERGLEAPTAQLHRLLEDLVGALMVVGGEFTVRADRVRIGELPGPVGPCPKCKGEGTREYDGGKPEACRSCDGAGEKRGRPDVISETLGFFAEWRGVPQLNDEPMTARALDYVLRDEDREGGGELAPSVEEAAAAVAAPEPDDVDDVDDDEPGDESDEDEE